MLPITVSPTTVSPGLVASRHLRAATHDEHLASEAALDFALLTSPAALAALLRGWVSVWQAVGRAAREPAACSTARTELLGPSADALAWLATDLADLAAVAGDGERRSKDQAGGIATNPPHRDASRGFSERLEVTHASWGVAYVLSGSRLGGAVLAPMLSQAVSLPDARGTSFLRSAGTDPGRDWVAFRRRLDSMEFSPAQLGSAVEAARWTFDCVGTELSVECRQKEEVAS